MKLDAIKHQGARTDLTSAQVGPKLTAAEKIAENSPDSKSQIKRFIRLTELIPELMDTPTLGMTQKNQPKIKYTLDFDVTPHQLRHTYITNLLYAGVDPKTVQYLAGHENSKTTMDIYAKVKYNKPEELFGVVNGAFHQAIAE